MVEIALSLGIIAFALIAIIGVLPTGLKVQKENREETIINQDGLFLLEAIRGGAKGIDDLTNFFESITISSTRGAITFTNALNAPNRLTNGMHIIGLLSTPKFEWQPNGRLQTNLVEAHVRAMSGIAGDRSRINDEMAFRYALRVEVVPFTTAPGTVPLPYSTNLFHNLYDVRLLARWPLFQKGDTWDTGRGRKVFRTLVSGELRRVPMARYSLYWFEPNTFTTNQFAVRF